jgi:hypothetical protein
LTFYGLQGYTGFTDDAPEFLVAYPSTPHDIEPDRPGRARGTPFPR